MEIYTDGSCIKNPEGPGGWAFCMHIDKQLFVVSGYDNCTTNNRMELTAVIEALKFNDNNEVIIYSDSQYVIKCAKKEFKIKANKDLWSEYDKVVEKTGVNIEWVWVKGHSGNYYNDLVDYYANNEAKKNFKK
jgi:ribonuclease HI